MNEKITEADILSNKAKRKEMEGKYDEAAELMKQQSILFKEGVRLGDKMHDLTAVIVETSKLSDKNVTMKGHEKIADRMYTSVHVHDKSSLFIYSSEKFAEALKLYAGNIYFCKPRYVGHYNPAIFSGERKSEIKILPMCTRNLPNCCPGNEMSIFDAFRSHFDDADMLSLTQGNVVYTNYDGQVEYSTGIDDAISIFSDTQ
ncbi:hypothetical protein [Candidatus Fokinia crypta]|uniref:Uncharacterized protein n=1 Tax=Candidatus Fokinia crypta TaxID=1920990 RepID=A0ABZ0UR62_9RICK|nr:hypothetical protein [Candidatus Fokinia cryptica]WPX97741.1 hypothetical protein Fokcrypt_00256 [Candidatus Fokinia cryptica]